MTAIVSPAQPAIVSPEQQLAALLKSSAVASLINIGWIKVTGDDRVRWLNGMTTNSIQALKSGELNYNFFLSSQGRIQGDAVALALDSSILLGTAADRVPALMELLDRFIIMDDVELAQHPSYGLLVAGPQAASTLADIGIAADDLAASHFTAINDWQGAHKVAILHAHSPLVPRFELWSESPDTIALLTEALITSGATSVDDQALTQLRILEGTPLYGTDIRDKELPQETAQTRALHFAKGCYLGQEIVERIRSRGNLHRTFHAFQLTGDLPSSGTILEADGKAIGELTSVAAIPLSSGSTQLALGYIRREALERGLTITYPGGEAKAMPPPLSTVERNS
jgi:folate-binding protein YgfZ